MRCGLRMECTPCSTDLARCSAAAGPNAGDATSFFPDFSRPHEQETLWTLPVLTFLVYIGLQWWAFWYPGAEPGGGGYIAQRIFAPATSATDCSPCYGSTSRTTPSARGPGY